MAVYAVNYPRFKAKEFKTLALQHGQSDGLPVPQLVYRPPVAQRHALRAKAAPCICQVCFRGGEQPLRTPWQLKVRPSDRPVAYFTQCL